MKIGMFLGSAGSSSGGPERYEVELVRNLAAIDHENEYELACLFADGPQRIGVDQDNFCYRVLQPRSRMVSMLTSLPWAMLRSDAQVWHATYVPPPFSPRGYIFTLVCSSMIEHPEFYPPLVRARLVALTRRAIAKADLIICISDHIRQVLKERFHVADERMVVCLLGVSEAFLPFDPAQSAAFVRARYGIEGPYFLFSGRWEPRKNIANIVRAFARFRAESPHDLKLVFTGERTWAAAQTDALIAQLGLSEHVLDLGKSPVAELPMLYAGATALVYPSLWEGFGLPIVEAMAAGLPVITSNNSSMAEIGSSAARLVDPRVVDEIAAAMVDIAGDAALRQTLRTRGLARARLFSWRNTALQTLDVYRRMEHICRHAS